MRNIHGYRDHIDAAQKLIESMPIEVQVEAVVSGLVSQSPTER